jgi:hypothetical protein
MEVYVYRIQITNSLRQSFVVTVVNETSMAGKHPRLADVRVREPLISPTELPHRFFQKLDRMLGCGVVMNP